MPSSSTRRKSAKDASEVKDSSFFLALCDRCTITGRDFRGQLCRHGGSLGDFLGCRSIGEILLAAVAVPIRNVAFFCSGSALCVNVFQVGVVVRVRAAVAFFANLTDRLSYAGCFAAGVVADFLVAVVADVIVICILVFGSGLAANIADMVLSASSCRHTYPHSLHTPSVHS